MFKYKKIGFIFLICTTAYITYNFLCNAGTSDFDARTKDTLKKNEEMLSPETKKSIQKDRPPFQEFKDEKKIETEVLVLNQDSVGRQTTEPESKFAKNYKLAAEIELSKSVKQVKINTQEPIENLISIVFVGGEGSGESEISQIEFNGERPEESMGRLSGRYFKDDWQNLNTNGNKFMSLSFVGKALNSPATLKVYLQYQQQEEE